MLSGGLGLALAGVCGLVAARRGLHREAPASVMAAGMAVMSLGMAGIGPFLGHGPWWAAGFAAVALWPLVRRPGRRVRNETVAHLLGGLAMIYMCTLPAMPVMPTSDGVGAAASPDHLGPASTGHAMAGMGRIDLSAVPSSVPGPLGGAPALLGWALACYFLLSTIITLTRRKDDGAPTPPRLTTLDEAATGLATAVMLVAVA
jgi:hypothetical protein